MAETTTWQRFKTYMTECARILYWAFFKPYTFRRWLKEIDSDLDDTTNPFSLRERFDANPLLHRYAGQVWWVSAVVPLLVTVLVGLAWTALDIEPFDWWASAYSLLGWSGGLWLARGGGLARWVWVVVVLLAVVGVLAMVVPVAIGQLLSYFLLVAVGVAFGEAVGVAGGVALGVAFGVALGVAFGVAVGVAFGVTFIAGVLRLYFWLPELAWVGLLYVWSRAGGGAAGLLRYLPARFDEFTVLPLPFVPTIIRDAYRENRAAARGTIDYLITSTNQQKAASRAIVAIAADSVARCRTVSDVVAVADELKWIPQPPPEGMGLALPQLLDVSQGARAALGATSPYRQVEMLRPPLAALDRLREGLAFDARQATLFGAAVDGWQSIIETAQRTLAQRAAESGEIPPVYVAGPSLDPGTAGTRFRGRVDVFREIETLALSPQPPTLLLHGGRRTGKTSALKFLPRRVGPSIVPLLVDVQGLAVATTLRGLAEGLAAQVIESARRARNLNLPAPDAEGLARDPFAGLLGWMERVERVAKGRRLLLCLDEFERLEEVVRASGSRAPLNFLRHVMQHRPRWTLLFAGARGVQDLASLWSDYLIHARALRVSYLDEADARDLIVRPVDDFPDVYETEAVDSIVRWTRCQPYLVQLLCTEVVERLNREGRQRAAAADVDASVPRAFETGGQYFAEFWRESATAEERAARAALSALARDGRLPGETAERVVRALVRREVVERVGEEWRFQVPLIRRWVREEGIGE